ncbi:hypothetical protein PHYBLDRAFT_157338 [Phycomyces blakesleeanus NRRL 1555(-)]|uniref:Uncharacterized protein n=1 Tax=Phycomyces blakesleeanus (strain ATCC 8743b / DSM 1359 / FGSC 10004 / NBRC 33097 / NRRL 1555) TaxID=763407 RepID=A0A162YCN3_PHYB8|nr:hypothetical protein PHYBLDRAFT_157338 [Phycomyces blakesleeanus NRRL 1555(-)]OAD79795.1 hypothetical protein PHYBLDRAFT_157338 [Phycomyces blakesleeanus NRRL 1555(-)]|eukprot:XP_018297835.1 hypothetical protein PHYBLDRAFT_157338 [Phycomyces blakesleeanus NRRL 1555(-)]
MEENDRKQQAATKCNFYKKKNHCPRSQSCSAQQQQQHTRPFTEAIGKNFCS